MFVKLTLAKNT